MAIMAIIILYVNVEYFYFNYKVNIEIIYNIRNIYFNYNLNITHYEIIL